MATTRTSKGGVDFLRDSVGSQGVNNGDNANKRGGL